MQAFKVAIAGAGPAGLAVALFLNRAGHEVSIFERFERPAPVGSGLILQPTGLSVLAELGLLDDILALGHRIERLFGTDAQSGRTVLDVRYSAGPRRRFGLGVQRAALFDLLHRAVERAGVPIRPSSTVVGIRDPQARPSLVFEDGSATGPFDLVIDASGSRSALVTGLLPGCRPKPLGYGAFWATLEPRSFRFDRHALVQRYDRASVMIGVLPVGALQPNGPERLAFFWSQKIAEVEGMKTRGIDAWKERLRLYWPELEPLFEQITSFDDMVLARYQHRTLPRPAAGNVAFIGDAAHCTSPQLGQGANMGLLDAAALASALASVSAVSEAVERYCRLRRLHVRLFQTLSYVLTPFYQSDSAFIPWIRDRLVANVAPIAPLPRILAAIVSGTLGDPLQSAGLAETDWSAMPALPAPSVLASEP